MATSVGVFAGTAPNAVAAAVACTPDPGFNRCLRFTSVGADQTFVVPVGVTSLDVRAWGAGGGAVSTNGGNGKGGAGGGYASGALAVTENQQLTIVVGEGPILGATLRQYGGGGATSGNPNTSAPGGGMSAVFSGPGPRLEPQIVAGGAGGSVFFNGNGAGGPGGGLTGLAIVTPGSAGGGTQSAGGIGAQGAQSGTQYVGGDGPPAGPGGGGGGGYFGGGGSGAYDVGSGGGSSFVSGPLSTNGVTLAGNFATYSGTVAGFVETREFFSGVSGGVNDSQYVNGIGSGGYAGRFDVNRQTNATVVLTPPAGAGNGMVTLQWLEPSYSVALTGFPSSLVAGTSTSVSVTVTNTGPMAYTAVRPAGVRVDFSESLVPFTVTGTSPSLPSWTVGAPQPQFVATGALAIGESVVLTFSIAIGAEANGVFEAVITQNDASGSCQQPCVSNVVVARLTTTTSTTVAARPTALVLVPVEAVSTSVSLPEPVAEVVTTTNKPDGPPTSAAATTVPTSARVANPQPVTTVVVKASTSQARAGVSTVTIRTATTPSATIPTATIPTAAVQDGRVSSMSASTSGSQGSESSILEPAALEPTGSQTRPGIGATEVASAGPLQPSDTGDVLGVPTDNPPASSFQERATTGPQTSDQLRDGPTGTSVSSTSNGASNDRDLEASLRSAPKELALTPTPQMIPVSVLGAVADGNAQPIPAAVQSQRSIFARSALVPSQVSVEPLEIVKSGAIANALLMMVAMPAFLFNSAFQSTYGLIQSRVTRRARWWAKVESLAGNLPIWLSLLLVSASGALLCAWLDPAFGANRVSLVAFVGMLSAFLVMNMMNSAMKGRYLRKSIGSDWRIRLYPTTMLVAVGLVVLSRTVGLLPGYLFGLLASLQFLRGRPSETEQARANALTYVALLLTSLVAWFAWGSTRHFIAEGDTSFVTLVLDATLASIWTCNLQSVLFGLLPIPGFDGPQMMHWNRKVWFGLYSITMTLFVHLMIAPSTQRFGVGAHLGEKTTAVVFGAFTIVGLLCLVFAKLILNRSSSTEIQQEISTPTE